MVTLKDIYTAAGLIDGKTVHTSCIRSKALSEITGADVIIKFENQQFTSSFKERGALVKLLTLTETQRKKGVITMSAGNHAQAVAYHASRLGIAATIVMPRFTPDLKIERTRSFGVDVIISGDDLAQAHVFAKDLAKRRDLLFIHPYDDEKIISGQGTIALEMLESFPDLEVMVVPVGGGGLISGNAIAAKGTKPEIELIGVQTSRFPSMLQVLQGKPIQCEDSTLAEGIAVSEPGRLTVPIVKDLVDDILIVDEKDIEAAVLLFLEVEKTVAEGAGAVGLAALLSNREKFKGRKTGLILSGGNMGLLKLSSIIQRGLVRSFRLVRLCVGIPDIPGALSDVTKLLGDLSANIMEIRHQRAFTNLSLRLAEVEFVVQARGKNHIAQIMDALAEKHYEASLPDVQLNGRHDLYHGFIPEK
jgi:threonine dehydratase